jgi:hypothetical protein
MYYQKMHVAQCPKIVAISPFSLQYQGNATNLGSLGKELGVAYTWVAIGYLIALCSVGIMEACCNDVRRGNLLLKQQHWSLR